MKQSGQLEMSDVIFSQISEGTTDTDLTTWEDSTEKQMPLRKTIGDIFLLKGAYVQ